MIKHVKFTFILFVIHFLNKHFFPKTLNVLNEYVLEKQLITSWICKRHISILKQKPKTLRFKWKVCQKQFSILKYLNINVLGWEKLNQKVYCNIWLINFLS